jgi:hypothetical protein
LCANTRRGHNLCAFRCTDSESLARQNALLDQRFAEGDAQDRLLKTLSQRDQAIATGGDPERLRHTQPAAFPPFGGRSLSVSENLASR